MKENKENDEASSLLDVFKIGDRVKQIYYDPNGMKREYAGIVVDIKKHCMAIHWDTVNGKPDSENRDTYSICHMYEIFNGDNYYSPIVKSNS